MRAAALLVPGFVSLAFSVVVVVVDYDGPAQVVWAIGQTALFGATLNQTLPARHQHAQRQRLLAHLARPPASTSTRTRAVQPGVCSVGPAMHDVGVDDWPTWATEAVHVVDADPAWATAGAAAAAELDALLLPWLVGEVEHVGSTSVPGLDAKPVLNLQAPVANFECAADVAETLAPHGWHYVPPELDGRPCRRFLVHVTDDRRTRHLHLLVSGSTRWADQLTFRDTLRADPELATRYGQLKHALAAEHPNDREAYTQGKADLVRAVLSRKPIM